MRNKSFGENNLSLLDTIIFKIRFKKIQKYITDTDVLVDLGCGYNAESIHFLHTKFKFKKIIGIDLNVNKNKNGNTIVLKQGNLNDTLDILDNSVDVVLSLAVLEHLDNPLHNLKEISRVLKPGGKLIITTPTPLAKPILEFMAHRLKLISSEEINDHKNYFDSKKLRDMLEEANFEKQHIHTSIFLFGFNNFVLATKK